MVTIVPTQPIIQDVLGGPGGAFIFDIANCFESWIMDKEDRVWTHFETPIGELQLRKASYGLKGIMALVQAYNYHNFVEALELAKAIIFVDDGAVKLREDIKLEEHLAIVEEVLKIFEVYGRMIGKNGISKLVLTSVIPIINHELDRLLDEVCDFDVQLEINGKNEVDFNIIKKDVVKKLKTGSGLETTLASLALRSVLGRISTLPKPNIIVFDEVLGKVANVNLDQVKIFFDKIKKMYETIFLISHNPIVQDWADKIITIEKNNDISSLQIK